MNFFPKNENELLNRANRIAGISLGELSKYMGVMVPNNLKNNKGWGGLIIESFLGADAKNKPIQDFSSIGIELKTIPINSKGKPIETTFICLVKFINNNGITWENCYLKKKLQRVLWIPIQGEKNIALSKRKIGTPFIWSPSKKQEYQLKQDWEELMDLIVLGKVEYLTGNHGKFLQLRTKAKNNKILTTAIDSVGQRIKIKPRSFYLRKNFTYKILRENYILQNFSL